MRKPLVSILIVNWNGKHFLKDCFRSLSQITYKNTEIVLVDNASVDNSISYIKEYYPKVKVIQNIKNLGFAQGNDIGLKEARGKAILLLNMDTIVEKSFLDNLITLLYSKDGIGAVQPKILLYPQKNRIDSIGSFLLPTGALYHFGREKDHRDPKFNRPMEIFSAKGACILIKKEVLNKTGLFDADYFAYFEETDLCQRIWLSGYKVMYQPSAIVWHKGGAASNKISSSYITFHAYKNMLLTYLKNFSTKYLMRILPVSLFLYEVVTILYFLQGKFGIAVSIQKAIFWNLFHLTETLKKRQNVQHVIRNTKDDNFLPKLMKSVNFIYYYYQFFGGMEKYKD